MDNWSLTDWKWRGCKGRTRELLCKILVERVSKLVFADQCAGLGVAHVLHLVAGILLHLTLSVRIAGVYRSRNWQWETTDLDTSPPEVAQRSGDCRHCAVRK
jgi:hypothetical protein